jgi:hypothetical protein
VLGGRAAVQGVPRDLPAHQPATIGGADYTVIANNTTNVPQQINSYAVCAVVAP